MKSLGKERKKNVYVGCYKHYRHDNTEESFNGIGGTNSWNELIVKNGWNGVMLDVVLVPRWRRQSHGE